MEEENVVSDENHQTDKLSYWQTELLTNFIT